MEVTAYLWILHRTRYLGSKSIITALSDKHGLCTAVATETNKNQRLQLGRLVVCDLVHKPSASMATLKSWSGDQWVPDLSSRAQAGLYHVSQFLSKVLAPQQPMPQVFIDYTELVTELEKATSQKQVRTLCLTKLIQFLKLVGHWPSLEFDAEHLELDTEQHYCYRDNALHCGRSQTGSGTGQQWLDIEQGNLQDDATQKLCYTLISQLTAIITAD